jgi:hypothetical protein
MVVVGADLGFVFLGIDLTELRVGIQYTKGDEKTHN